MLISRLNVLIVNKLGFVTTNMFSSSLVTLFTKLYYFCIAIQSFGVNNSFNNPIPQSWETLASFNHGLLNNME
jgi:hypothetical protein